MPGERRGGWKPSSKPEGSEGSAGDTIRDVRRIENERGLDERVSGEVMIPEGRPDLDDTTRRLVEAFDPKLEPDARDDSELTVRMQSPFAQGEAPRAEIKNEREETEKVMMKHILKVGGHDFRSAEYRAAMAAIKTHQAECEELIHEEIGMLNLLIELMEAEKEEIMKYLLYQNNPEVHVPDSGFDGQYTQLSGLYPSEMLFGQSNVERGIPLVNIKHIRDILIAAQKNITIEKSVVSRLMRRIRG